VRRGTRVAGSPASSAAAEAGDERRRDGLRALLRVDAEHPGWPRDAPSTWRAAEGFGPVAGEALDVVGLAGVRERMVQHRILQHRRDVRWPARGSGSPPRLEEGLRCTPGSVPPHHEPGCWVLSAPSRPAIARTPRAARERGRRSPRRVSREISSGGPPRQRPERQIGVVACEARRGCSRARRDECRRHLVAVHLPPAPGPGVLLEHARSGCAASRLVVGREEQCRARVVQRDRLPRGEPVVTAQQCPHRDGRIRRTSIRAARRPAGGMADARGDLAFAQRLDLRALRRSASRSASPGVLSVHGQQLAGDPGQAVATAIRVGSAVSVPTALAASTPAARRRARSCVRGERLAADVSVMPARLRVNSGTPISRSTAATCSDSDCIAMCSALAACRTFPDGDASTYRICRRSTPTPYMTGASCHGVRETVIRWNVGARARHCVRIVRIRQPPAPRTSSEKP